jgi:uncharacterized alpha-E superfamily protein
MPRSLRFCYDWLETAAEGLAAHYGERRSSADLIAETRTMLKTTSMDTIFQGGLHEFLGSFIAGNNRVTNAVSSDYNFG